MSASGRHASSPVSCVYLVLRSLRACTSLLVEETHVLGMRMCAWRRLALAHLIAEPELLPAAATAMTPLSDREADLKLAGRDHCLASVIGASADAAWSAIQVCLSLTFTKGSAQHSARLLLGRSQAQYNGCLRRRHSRKLCFATSHPDGMQSMQQTDVSADAQVQDCQQNSKRLPLLSALLSAIFQRELFGISWESSSTTDDRWHPPPPRALFIS